MKRLFKEFLYFSRGERRGTLALLALIVLAFLCGNFLLHRTRQKPSEPLDAVLSPEAKELPADSTRRTPFNPNRADSATLRGAGIPGWMARNIVRYRERGGRFRRAEDLLRIYGMTEERYRELSPYIYIAPEDTVHPARKQVRRPRRDSSARIDADTPRFAARLRRDSFPRKLFKYPQGTIIELNSSDTTELKKIPGIGSVIARRIIGYRQRLGGFYRIGQLAEIGLDTALLCPWFRIDADSIRRIDVNRASLERLRRHPYINFYQARAIVEYRKKQGKLKSLKPLSLLEEFPKEELERMLPYLAFD